MKLIRDKKRTRVAHRVPFYFFLAWFLAWCTRVFVFRDASSGMLFPFLSRLRLDEVTASEQPSSFPLTF